MQPMASICKVTTHLTNLRVHAVDDNRFVEFKNQLSWLHADNVTAMQQKLVEVGLSLGPAAEV